MRRRAALAPVRRRLQPLTVTAILALALSPLPSLQPSPVAATRLDGTKVVFVPVRWCAVRGSPAAERADTDLTGRMRRAGAIWARKANISFRSPIRPNTKDLTLPLINDPVPPSAGGKGELGDILDPDDFDQSEALNAIKRCRKQWTQRSIASGHALVGPVAVNAYHLITDTGAVSEGLGWAKRSLTKPSDYCNHGGAFKHTWLGALVIVDRSTTSRSYDDELLAHELGHVLTLAHGDGKDNGWLSSWDRWCDPDEAGIDSDRNLMYFSADDGRTGLTSLQKDQSYRVAKARHGIVIDPPGELEPGDSIGDEVADDAFEDDRDIDAELPTLDVTETAIGLYVADDPAESSLLISQSLAGIPAGETNRYWAYADTDGDEDTGFMPTEAGYPAGGIRGVDLIASVVVVADGSVIPSVLRWDQEAFKYFEVFDDRITAAIEAAQSEAEQEPADAVVSIEIPTDVIGPISYGEGMGPAPAPVRLELVSQIQPADDPLALQPDGVIDVVPNEEDGVSVALYLERPSFPVCTPSADAVEPEDRVVLTTSGFGAEHRDEPVSAFFDDEELPITGGATTIDETGAVQLEIQMPGLPEAGIGTASVVLTGTALAADCVLQVGDLPPEEEP